MRSHRKLALFGGRQPDRRYAGAARGPRLLKRGVTPRRQKTSTVAEVIVTAQKRKQNIRTRHVGGDGSGDQLIKAGGDGHRSVAEAVPGFVATRLGGVTLYTDPGRGFPGRLPGRPARPCPLPRRSAAYP